MNIDELVKEAFKNKGIEVTMVTDAIHGNSCIIDTTEHDKQIKADERAKVFEEVSKSVEFEEKQIVIDDSLTERARKEWKRDIWIGLGWIIFVVIFACGVIAHVRSQTYKNYMDYKTWFENLYVENREIKEQNETLVTENEELTIQLDELTDKYNTLVRDYNSIALVKLESEE